MLGKLRIRQKLAVLLVIPLTAVALAMAGFTVERVALARSYSTTADTALAAREIGGLIQTLQQERLVALGYLVVGTLERRAVVTQSQTAVADTARLAADPRTATIIGRAQPQLDALTDVRHQVVDRQISTQATYDAYRSAIFTLMESLGLANPQVGDAEGLRALLALDSLMRSNEEASSAGAIVVASASDPAFDSTLLTSVLGADESHLDRFRQLVGVQQRSLVDTVQAGEAANRLREHTVTVLLGGTPTPDEVSEALTAAISYTGLRRLAQDRVARDTALAAQREADQATLVATGVAAGASVLFLLVAALAVTVGRSISAPLRRLGRAVGAVAELSRAELVRVADSEATDTAPPELASVEVDSDDEIGDLATAVNRVQSTAAMLLERQVTARANVATMFANVSRRTQNLVGRQLNIIEELVRAETNPAARERLSQLQHITTRLRRSADSLLVVSGTIDQQLAAAPSRLADVIRAALAEIEAGSNVEVVQPIPDVTVSADLAGDLRLLLAELLENATNFTPPGASVRIGAAHDHFRGGSDGGAWTGEAGRHGGPYAPDCTIAVVDHGLGMSPAKMEEENQRLVERERLDVAPTRVLGLFVVGRLARRHGLSVRLEPSPGRGVTAMVRIPARLLNPGSVPGVVPAAVGLVPPTAMAAIESASRSGPFPWLSARSGPPAIGSAPVSGAPVSGAPVTAPPAGSTIGPRTPRDPEAEREQLNDFVSGFARATGDPTPEPDPRPTPAERHP